MGSNSASIPQQPIRPSQNPALSGGTPALNPELLQRFQRVTQDFPNGFTPNQTQLLQRVIDRQTPGAVFNPQQFQQLQRFQQDFPNGLNQQTFERLQSLMGGGAPSILSAGGVFDPGQFQQLQQAAQGFQGQQSSGGLLQQLLPLIMQQRQGSIPTTPQRPSPPLPQAGPQPVIAPGQPGRKILPGQVAAFERLAQIRNRGRR